jgi:anti-sigma-K factor RskA
VRQPDPVDYLLGELEPAAAVDFEAALAADPALRARVERLRPVMARLETLPADAWDPPAPPPLEAAHGETRPRGRIVLRPLAAVACAVALVAAGAVGALLTGGEDGPAPPAAAQGIELAPVGGARPAEGRVELARSGAAPLTLRVAGLRALGRGRFYELWLLGERGELVSLGSFVPAADGTATVTLPLPVDPGRFAYFDVSAEPADGDPAHSGDSVLRGPAGS